MQEERGTDRETDRASHGAHNVPPIVAVAVVTERRPCGDDGCGCGYRRRSSGSEQTEVISASGRRSCCSYRKDDPTETMAVVVATDDDAQEVNQAR